MNIKRKNMKRTNESGNVLFLILIAVALFAALSYAVTSSSRSGGGDAASESNLINSAQVTQYPSSVRTAIVRMIINSTTDSQLLFEGPSDFANLSTPALERRGVFHPSGGGATRVSSTPDIMASGSQGTWIFTSDFGITQIGTTDATNGSNDIIAFLPGVAESICKRINTELGISVTPDADSDGVPDSGIALANIPVIADEMDTGNQGIGPAAQGASKVIGGAGLSNQPFGCADFDATTDQTDDSDLVYYHVLIER